MPRIQFLEFFWRKCVIDRSQKSIRQNFNLKIIIITISIISPLFHLIISSIQQYQNYEKQEIKWKEKWNKNIQQPNIKKKKWRFIIFSIRKNGISLKRRNISNGKKWIYRDNNNELYSLKNNSEYLFQTVEPQIISKENDTSIRNNF